MDKPDCLFCRIVKGEIPASVVYEDEHVLAFRDILPQAPVHVLVIPKDHYDKLTDIPSDSELYGQVFNAVRKVAELEGISDGFRTSVNCGSLGGQVVWHVHFHVLGGRQMSGKLG